MALFSLFFSWLLVSPAFGIEIHEGQVSLDVDRGIRYFVEQNPLSIDQINQLEEDTWAELDGPINFGYTDQTYWFKFTVENNERTSLSRVLQVTYPLLDHIGVYLYSGENLRNSFATGDALPFSHRPVSHRHFVFPLQFDAKQRHNIYLRVQTSGALQAPMVMWEERAFHAEDAKENVVNAMYYGILLIMAAFNLLLYFFLKESSYLFYVFFVSSILLLMSSLYGYSYQYLYPGNPKAHGLIILLIVPIAQISICFFTIQFLQLAKARSRWYNLFVTFIVIDVLCMIGALVFPYNLSTRISVTLTLPIAVSAMIVGIQFWRRGDQSARLFSVAWLAFLVGTTGIVLNRLGIIPTSFFTEQGIPISTSAQTLLFALALAARFNTERDARMKAQQEYLEEIRKRRDAETQLVYAASHHEITGLPNRLLFERSIYPYLETRQRGREFVSVMLLHVRRFDDVNKTLGHRNADVLLRRIGGRINDVVKVADGPLPLDMKEEGAVYVAHVEGVSFCFALAKDSKENTIAQVELLMRQMSEPMEFMGLSLELSFLVGCSFAEQEELDPQTLLRQAFVAFDTADTKLSPIAVYEPKMNPYSPKRLTLMTELRSAIEYDGLELYFQPQIDLKTKKVCGFEALLRWIHHEYGFVPPDEFIPMAEKTGLMKPLTRWVLGRALDFCKKLDDLSCSAHVSVNISALNLREPGFCRQVCDLLGESQVNAERLVLEVTETAAMVDPESAMAVLGELNETCIRLSIDDFGTGHSSLAYIRKLPVHEIKIDRSFVGEMDQNKGDATIVQTTINMCHDLGYDVVAEGVENQQILEMLGDMNCDMIQGYHIARPMNASDTFSWLRDTTWQL